jgi:hypothetical protein
VRGTKLCECISIDAVGQHCCWQLQQQQKVATGDGRQQRWLPLLPPWQQCLAAKQGAIQKNKAASQQQWLSLLVQFGVLRRRGSGTTEAARLGWCGTAA